MKADEVVKIIVDELKELDKCIKEGKPKDSWVMPFALTSSLPKNKITDTKYKGFNLYMLYRIGKYKGYTMPEWAGWNQWINSGERIRFDERKNGSQILVPHLKEIEKIDGSKTKEMFFLRKNVFNIEQTEGYDYNAKLPKRKDIDTVLIHKQIENLKQEWNLNIKIGTSAYYDSNQTISLPPIEDYKGNDIQKHNDYYSVLFHELIHWTGHSSRLDRKVYQSYHKNKNARSKEELIAEIGSALMCNHYGLEVNIREDHTRYIHSWAEYLTDKPNALITCTNQAYKAYEYLIGQLTCKDT